MSNEDLRRLLDNVQANPAQRSSWRDLERALLRMGYTHAAQPVTKWKECCKPEVILEPTTEVHCLYCNKGIFQNAPVPFPEVLCRECHEAGRRIEHCRVCGIRVVRSPSTRALLAPKGLQSLCADCAEKTLGMRR